jgi:Ca2+-transporting ATPase
MAVVRPGLNDGRQRQDKAAMPVRQVPQGALDEITDSGLGLTSTQAAQRLATFGANDILVAPPSTWKDIAKDTAGDPMIWFLAGVSLVFLALGKYGEGSVLLAALVPLVGMDTWLHLRTQASTQGLASRLAARAIVMRDGQEIDLSARDVVPGDLVLVRPGSPLPADGLFVTGTGLQCDVSSLTGESWPVRKSVIDATQGLASSDVDHWGFAGTRLLAGEGRLRVVATGNATLYADIVRSALSGAHELTPLQASIGRMVSLLLAGAIGLCVLLGAVRLIQGHGIVDALVSAATLAVAALPEEFPVVFTMFLGVGVYRLATRKALVRRAVAVENIGRLTCICSDKTGTLTEGRLELTHVVPADGLDREAVLAPAAFAARTDSGDPLDQAVLAALNKPAHTPLATFPFTEDRRREVAVLRLPDGAVVAAMKGAPEAVFELCACPGFDAGSWQQKTDELGASGHKVVAVARQALPSTTPTDVEPASGWQFCGLVAFEDPVRDGVPEAVRRCKEGGIRIIMVTGDHPTTAAAVAREIGLGDGAPVVVAASELEATLTRPGAGVARFDVVARATPGQKLRLVEALKRLGEIVAVTGDGVNDVPALKAADIGIAMGERGTQSAREVASIVLLDDNFRTIADAVAEGRQMFLNLQLAFAYLLLIHFPLVISAAVVPLMGLPLLYLPVHVVWLELIIHPTALLGFQDGAPEGPLLGRPSTGPAGFFSRRAWIAISIWGVVFAAVVFAAFALTATGDSEVGHARALAIGSLIAMSAGATLGLSQRFVGLTVVVPALSMASLFCFTQVPMLAGAMELQPLSPVEWFAILGLVGLSALLARGLRTFLNVSGQPDG